MADVEAYDRGVVNPTTGSAVKEKWHDNGDGTFSRTSYSQGGTLPTGAATSAKQDTGNASLASLASAVQTEDAAHSSGDKGVMALAVRQDTAAALAGNGDYIPLTVDSEGRLYVTLPQGAYSASVSLTRTNDTNAYAAGDVVGSAVGSTAALTLASMGPSGGRIMITSVSLEIDASAVISGETSYTLHLYDVTPPSALGDNAAFDLPSGDRASYLGSISLGTPVDLGATLYVETNGINKQLKLSGTSLFGYLVTAGAHTPTASRVYVVKLHAVVL